ncbi:XdhC family protein, partial [Candidatus Bathyarchaeota archaeon]|nr:XdhC family protein [Candidatus Bathyarchaeota archaeon]
MGVEPTGNAIPVDSKCGGVVKVFMDVIKPLPRLIIVGSGHIAKPLADLAEKVGFEIIVVDDAETATRERFPTVKELRNGPFGEEMKNLELRSSDYVAIVHGETLYELEALRTALRSRPAYIGLLGSVNKANQHKKQLIGEGFSRETVESICAPIGLHIGAETPEEIAVSIVAELIKKRRSQIRRAF